MSLSNFNLTVPHKNLYCSDSCSSLSTGLAGSLSSVLFHTQHRWALILQAFVCMCILCAIVYMFKTCHTQKADHLWKVIFPWCQYNFSMNHHHKQVSLMRNSWSDLFLLGLVQVTNYNKTISLDVINLMLTYGYLSHLERRLSIYFIHSHSAAPNCAFPLSCLHWQVNFLTGWKKTDFLCKGKLEIAHP